MLATHSKDHVLFLALHVNYLNSCFQWIVLVLWRCIGTAIREQNIYDHYFGGIYMCNRHGYMCIHTYHTPKLSEQIGNRMRQPQLPQRWASWKRCLEEESETLWMSPLEGSVSSDTRGSAWEGGVGNALAGSWNIWDTGESGRELQTRMTPDFLNSDKVCKGQGFTARR